MGDGARGRERERAPEDLYAILGVARDASKAVLKNAYRRLAIQLHPDKTKDDQAAQERFKKVNEAYRTLLDEQKRAAYDRAGHAGLDEEANKEKREKLKAGFLAWAKQYFDEKSSKGLYKTLKRLLEEFGDYDHFIANDLLTAEGMIERIPEGERKAYMDKREEIISRVLAERQARGSGARAGAGAGAGAGARGGAGAGDPGRGGDTGERERARREYEAKKKKFDEAFDGWMDDARDGSLFKDALHLLRQGQSFEDVTRTAGRDFGGVFDASGLPVSDRPGYLKRMRETLQRAKDAYEASRAGAGAGGGNRRDAGNQEQEHRERQRETFRIKMDGLFNERAFGGFYAEALSFLNRGSSLEDVQKFAEIRFINELRGYEAYVTEQDKKLYRARIKAALQSAKDAYEASRAGAGAGARGGNRGDSGNREQERERKRREFRSRADQLIADMAEYVKTDLMLGHTVESIKAVSLDVLDKIKKEYPDFSEAEAQTYRTKLEKSIDDAAAAFEKSKPRDRAKEAFDVWAAGVEDEAYQAFKGGEPYAKVYNRIEEEAKRKVSSMPVAKQERYVKQATDAVDKAFTKNEREKKIEYRKWATAWFGSLRESCEAGLKLGTSPDVIKDELRKMLESKVAVLPRQEDRNDELSRMEAMVDTIITVWKNGPGKTWDAAAERDRGEARGAGEAWLQNEAAQKIREMLISGMAKSEVEPAVRGILLAKIKILPELERKAFFDRLAQLVNTEHARYEQDRRKEPIEAEKNREKFEAWVRPWLANLPKSCMSWLEGRKFVNGAWEPLQQRYSPEKVKSHVAATLTEQLKLIPRGEHDVYIDRKDEIVAAAIMLDVWIKSLPVLCAPFFAESAPFGKVRESVTKDLKAKLSAVSLDQHAAYEASVEDSLARLEKAYNTNLRTKGDTNKFFQDVF